MSWTARIRYLAQAKRLASSTLVANESRSYGKMSYSNWNKLIGILKLINYGNLLTLDLLY